MKESAEFWWDAINTHKISPRGMPAYDRNEANAVFMARRCRVHCGRFAVVGHFNDPAKSKIAGKVTAAHFPLGPNRRSRSPGTTSGAGRSRRRLARAQGARQANAGRHVMDEEGQIKLWKATGGPPPNMTFWPKIAARIRS